MLRYGIGLAIPRGTLLPTWAITLSINVTGSFLIAFLSAIGQRHYPNASFFRPLLITGFCGGFTTFSTFTYEAHSLFARGDTRLAGLYIISSLLFAFAGLLLGYYLGEKM